VTTVHEPCDAVMERAGLPQLAVRPVDWGDGQWRPRTGGCRRRGLLGLSRRRR